MSNASSIHNTPMKNSTKFGNFGNLRVNHHNLISPYKPIKNDAMDIQYSFFDKHDSYHYQSSPLIGSNAMLMGMGMI